MIYVALFYWLMVLAMVYGLYVADPILMHKIIKNSATPLRIYRTTKVNWFGSFIMYLAILVMCPYWIFFTIAFFFKWLFTLGRKK